MYKIDVSFIKSSLLTSDNLKKIETDINQHFKCIIKDTVDKHIHPQISGCLSCGADCLNEVPYDDRKILEIDCKGMLGCHFCEIPSNLKDQFEVGDFVIIKDGDYYEIGKVRETSEIVQLRRYEMGLYGEKLPFITRKASPEDIEQYNKNLLEEIKAKPIFLKLVSKHNLNMKLVSIHYQYDRKRLFFFYTSDGRVDFRELAKDLAAEFKTRIELRQMGVRDEAKKIGGLGTCGREYCCASFLSNFKRITTQLANEQNLISNLSKLSGPCGKLKCCLSFEIEEN